MSISIVKDSPAQGGKAGEEAQRPAQGRSIWPLAGVLLLLLLLASVGLNAYQLQQRGALEARTAELESALTAASARTEDSQRQLRAVRDGVRALQEQLAALDRLTAAASAAAADTALPAVSAGPGAAPANPLSAIGQRVSAIGQGAADAGRRAVASLREFFASLRQ